MIGNEMRERVEECIDEYLRQTVNANLALDKEIKKRMGMEWTALENIGIS